MAIKKIGMKLIKVFILFILVSIVQSCDYYQKQIGEYYFIRCIDVRESMSIGFGTKDANEGILGPTVFEIHWNSDYILAKRHPLQAPGINGINRDITDYYILKKVKFGEAKASQNIDGPMKREEYEIKKKELALTESEMEAITFEDLK